VVERAERGAAALAERGSHAGGDLLSMVLPKQENWISTHVNQSREDSRPQLLLQLVLIRIGGDDQ
jgi:hypothetical protein